MGGDLDVVSGLGANFPVGLQRAGGRQAVIPATGGGGSDTKPNSGTTVEVPSGGATCYRTDFAGCELIEKVVDYLAGWSTTSEWKTDNVGRGSLLSSR